MTAMRYDIADRHRRIGVEPASPSHFTLTNPQSCEAELALDPAWTLYCFDPETDTALFVLTPPTDLSKAVFAYEVQFQTATQALILPLDAIADMANDLPQPEQVLLIFSTGRCGSTLFSRVLGAMPDVWSLSEPDAFTNLAMKGHTLPSAKIVNLLRAAVSLSFRPPSPFRIYAPKFRSEVFSQIPHYANSFPTATSCFLFRDLEGYADSSFRFTQRLGFQMQDLTYPEAAERWMMISVSPPEATLDVLVEDKAVPVGPEIFMAARWLERMEGGMIAAEAGLSPHLVSYRQMTADPKSAFSPVLDACGIEPGAISQASDVFAQDSQAGSVASGRSTEKGLSKTQKDNLRRLVTRTERFALVGAFFGPDAGL